MVSVSELWGAFILINYFFDTYFADMIEELIGRGQQVDAVHFTYEVGLANKFPPVPLLRAFLKDAKKAATSLMEDPNNSGRAAVRFHLISNWYSLCCVVLDEVHCQDESSQLVLIAVAHFSCHCFYTLLFINCPVFFRMIL